MPQARGRSFEGEYLVKEFSSLLLSSAGPVSAAVSVIDVITVWKSCLTVSLERNQSAKSNEVYWQSLSFGSFRLAPRQCTVRSVLRKLGDCSIKPQNPGQEDVSNTLDSFFLRIGGEFGTFAHLCPSQNTRRYSVLSRRLTFHQSIADSRSENSVSD